MITGIVKGDEAWIRLRARGPRGGVQELHALIDTGYTGSLTLPPALVKALGLRWRSVDRARLADGSEFIFERF